jgi:hypothetical protein
MADTVNVLGHPMKKNTVLLGGLAGVAVIIVAVVRKNKAAAAGSSTTAGTGQFTDPAGNVCSAPDPSTGYCPGTPEDTSAQEQLSAGSDDYGLDYGGGLGGLNTGNSPVSTGVPVFTDNGSWATYAEQQLGSNGSDAIAAAIAKYLSGQSVTSAQQTTIEEAIAIANYPPVSGAGGYPPSMHLSAGGGGANPLQTVTIPRLAQGTRVEDANSALSALGLTSTLSETRKPGVAYYVTAEKPVAGTKVQAGSSVALTISTKP